MKTLEIKKTGQNSTRGTVQRMKRIMDPTRSVERATRSKSHLPRATNYDFLDFLNRAGVDFVKQFGNANHEIMKSNDINAKINWMMFLTRQGFPQINLSAHFLRMEMRNNMDSKTHQDLLNLQGMSKKELETEVKKDMILWEIPDDKPVRRKRKKRV